MSLLPWPGRVARRSHRSSHSDGSELAAAAFPPEDDDEDLRATRTRAASALRAESRTPTCLQVARAVERASAAASNEGRGSSGGGGWWW